MVLLIFKSNYADEFKIEEMMTIDESPQQVYGRLKDIVKYCAKEPQYEFYFGTNEYIPAESVFLTDFKIIDLESHPEVSKFLGNLFEDDGGKFGVGILSQLLDFARDRKPDEE